MRKYRFTSEKDNTNKIGIIANVISSVCIVGSVCGVYYLLRNKIDKIKEYLETVFMIG